MPPRHRLLPTAAAILLLAVVVHLPSLSNGFALDDVPHVRLNEQVHDLSDLEAVLARPYLPHTDPRRSPYRPLTSLSFALDWERGGGAPGAFHQTNVALHGAASLAVLGLLLALGLPLVGAGAGACLFAVHPVHVEAVAGIVGRGDVLATLLVLGATLAYLARRLGRLRPWVVAGLYALALASKETGATLPALLVVLEGVRSWIRSGGEPKATVNALWRERGSWAAMGAVLAGYLLVRRWVLGVVGTYDVAPYIATLPVTERVTTAVANLTHTLRLLFLPTDLSSEYGPALIETAGPGDVRFWAGVAVAAGAALLAGFGVVTAARTAERRTPAPVNDSAADRRSGQRPLPAWGAVALGIAWIAVAILPVSNLLLPAPLWVAERTLYLASVGAVLVAGAALGRLVADRARRGHPAAEPSVGGPPGPWPFRRIGRGILVGSTLLALVVAGAVRSWERSRVWRSTETVMDALARDHPESFRALWWEGEKLLDRGEMDRALEHFDRAVEANPNDAFLRLERADALLTAGRPRAAEAAVRAVPEGWTPSWYVTLGRALVAQGRDADAREVVESGLDRHPEEPRLRALAPRLGIPVPTPDPSDRGGREP